MYGVGGRLEDKESSVLQNGQWCWRAARSKDLVHIKSQLHAMEIGELDQAVWIYSKKGLYSCAKTWEFIRLKCLKVSSWRVIWHYFSIPKHAFILWLAANDRLPTGENLTKWGLMGDNLCVFCRSCIEGEDHLFFLCSFSHWLWRQILNLRLISDPSLN